MVAFIYYLFIIINSFNPKLKYTYIQYINAFHTGN